MHRNNLFTCKRQCNKVAVKEKEGDWMNTCINVAKPQFSIYSYCDNQFEGYMNITTCKLDTCRVCCVTADQITRKKDSMENLQMCFQSCATRFLLSPSKLSS